MKKKLWATLFALVSALCLCLGLAACAPDETVAASEGLQFELNGDMTSYKVTGIGTCGDLDVIIPSKHQGYPVTSIGEGAFWGCYSLTSITIPTSVTSIGDHAFASCNSLTSITIPESVTSIGDYAFSGCRSLTSITIPESVTEIGDYAFYYCWLLQSVTFDGDSQLTSIGQWAFEGCSSLESITIPASVTSIEWGAFYRCSSLQSVTFEGDSQLTSIGEDAFESCDSLTSIIIPASVTSIGSGVFGSCDLLARIEVAQGNPVYHSDGNCIVKTESKTLIAGCNNSIIPDDGSVTSIGDYAFSGCNSLTSITLPESVTSIGRAAFYGCDSLTSVRFEQTDGWKVSYYSNNAEDVSVSDPEVAAEYLTDTYDDYYWERT